MTKEIIDNPVTGERLVVLESTPETFKMQFNLRPKGAVAGAHMHPLQQTFRVLSGALVIRAGNETLTLRAGETKILPPGTPHDQSNPFDEEAVAIEEYHPAGRIHDFFRVLFAFARDGKTDKKGNPPLLLMVALLSEFRDSIGMPNAAMRAVVRVLAPLSRWLGYDRVVRDYLQGRATEEVAVAA